MPAFCVWGYVAAAGSPDADDLRPLLTAAASLEVLHVSALVHDDVMDSSDLRRGRRPRTGSSRRCTPRRLARATRPPSAGPGRSCSATCW